MADRPPAPLEFFYHNIELYKSETLGSGSYGGVCKAKCDGLLCAAKIMHPTLFDLHDPGTASYLSKFREECHLFSLARHPNIVQYLGIYTDPDMRLPVLLVGLCDKSLTAFLERSPGPLSYHVQVDICHDIALALVYLHSNGLIHRDLTGNNVLMVAGPRAKITDFGMSKLANINPCMMTLMTLCPGNMLYMSPEALDEAKYYTAKLDVFSFGVLVIQILTRLFPNPTDRFRSVSSSNNKEEEVSDDEDDETQREIREVVPEIKRREAHLKLIPNTHPLIPPILLCLKKKERHRPTALELSDRLSRLKQSSQYRESRLEVDCKQCTERQERISELEVVVREKEQWLQEKDNELYWKEREHQAAMEVEQRAHQVAIQRVISSRDLAFKELQTIELESAHNLQQKDKTITVLQQIISDCKKRIEQLEQQASVSIDTPHHKIVTAPQTPAAAYGVRDISMMEWEKGMNAPEPMRRGMAVVNGNTAYFIPVGSVRVYSYQSIQRDEQWSQLPDNPNVNCGLAVIDGLLTSIGGWNDDFTNILLSLREEGEKKEWAEIFPPMTKSRDGVACVTAGETLVVAGGGQESGMKLDTVEVMNTTAKQWTTVCPLPEKCVHLSATVCGDELYVYGGFGVSKSVFTCSLPDLLPSTSLASKLRRSFSSSHGVWRRISELPVKDSTLVTFVGNLLAIGGEDDPAGYTHDKPVSNVYRYDSHTDSWTVASQMMKKRSLCFAVSLPEDYLIVVGGYNEQSYKTESVEICLCNMNGIL